MTTKIRAINYFRSKRGGKPLTLGEVIWSIRMADEVSQVEFAKKLGVSRAHLCDIEKGRTFIGAERAAKYAEILQQSKILFVQLALQELMDRYELGIFIEKIAEK